MLPPATLLTGKIDTFIHFLFVSHILEKIAELQPWLTEFCLVNPYPHSNSQKSISAIKCSRDISFFLPGKNQLTYEVICSCYSSSKKIAWYLLSNIWHFLYNPQDFLTVTIPVCQIQYVKFHDWRLELCIMREKK